MGTDTNGGPFGAPCSHYCVTMTHDYLTLWTAAQICLILVGIADYVIALLYPRAHASLARTHALTPARLTSHIHEVTMKRGKTRHNQKLFSRGAQRVHPKNNQNFTNPMRGGIRL